MEGSFSTVNSSIPPACRVKMHKGALVLNIPFEYFDEYYPEISQQVSEKVPRSWQQNLTQRNFGESSPNSSEFEVFSSKVNKSLEGVEVRKKRETDYHITIIPAYERKRRNLSCSDYDDQIEDTNVDNECKNDHLKDIDFLSSLSFISLQFYIMGLVIDNKNKIAYMPCIFPGGNMIRREFRYNHILNPIEDDTFHITVGFEKADNHSVSKTLWNLRDRSSFFWNEVNKALSEKVLSKAFIKYLHENIDPINLPLHKAYIQNISQTFFEKEGEQEDNLSPAKARKCSSTNLKLQYQIDELLKMFANGHKQPAIQALIRLKYDPLEIEKLIENVAFKDASNVLNYIQSNIPLHDRKIWFGVEIVNDNSIINSEIRDSHVLRGEKPSQDLNPCREIIRKFKAPGNFSRIDDYVYASAIIKDNHVNLLDNLQIRTIINLMESPTSISVINEAKKRNLHIKFCHFPIDDRCATDDKTMRQIINVIMSAVDKKESVLIHCLGGKGRTAMVFHCYLIQKYGCYHESIIDKYREKRITILARPQVVFIKNWERFFITFGANEQDLSNNIKYENQSRPKAIIMCGLPGSGKSTFSKHLEKFCLKVRRVSQDEMGQKLMKEIINQIPPDVTIIVDRCNLTIREREEWFSLCEQNYRSSGSIGNNVWCIFMNLPPESCKYRVLHRLNHESLQGPGGAKIIDQMSKKIQVPTVSSMNVNQQAKKSKVRSKKSVETIHTQEEEMEIVNFSKIIQLNNEEEVDQLLNLWTLPKLNENREETIISKSTPIYNQRIDTVTSSSINWTTETTFASSSSSSSSSSSYVPPPASCASKISRNGDNSYGTLSRRKIDETIPKIIKFPRTRHLFNLGSATRDDLLLKGPDQSKYLKEVDVYVEEKIDGANLGFSIDPHTFQVRAQNRSHFVNSNYHPQFRKLDKWIHTHTEDLFQIIVPGRHILYGEWVFAKHSIGYNKLPAYFIAFDLFDIEEGTFASRRKLEVLLGNTKIPLIRLIAHQTFESLQNIINLVHSKSIYYDGLVEGVVVRICDDAMDITKERAKIVRADFLSGDIHWSKYSVTENILSRQTDG